jgi:hypothetical protein
VSPKNLQQMVQSFAFYENEDPLAKKGP